MVSFGHRFGNPRDTAVNVNLRRVKNVPAKARAALTGLDKRFSRELFLIHGVEAAYQSALEAADRAVSESKGDSVRVGLGCEMGVHRSVAFAQRMALERGWHVEHRDLRSRRNNRHTKDPKRKGRVHKDEKFGL